MKDFTDRSGPKTLRRGLQIIEVLRAAGDEGLKIADIAALTGIQRTTVYRFLDVLVRSEEHTSELQSLMRISYAVFCLKKKTTKTDKHAYTQATKHNTYIM